MSGSKGSLFNYIVEPEQRRGWAYVVGALISTLLAVACWMQTDSFLTLFQSPTYDQIREHIRESNALQAGISRKSGKIFPTDNFTYLSFSESQTSQLEAARKFVLSDDELEKKINEQFKVSLKDVRAVVVPLWETDNVGYCPYIGITEKGGWPDVVAASGNCNIGATTIRDRPDATEQRTIDGRPRIILNPNAFANTSWTRRVVFHEMLHALNVPAFRPSHLTQAQTDLIYLSEYRWFVKKASLNSLNEFLYRFFACVFWSFALVSTSLLLVRTYRRHKRNRLPAVEAH